MKFRDNNNKKVNRTYVLISMVLTALILASCGGNNVNADLSGFGQNGGTSTVPQTTIGDNLDIGNPLSKDDMREMIRVVLGDNTLGCEAVRSIVTGGWQSGGNVYWSMQSGAAPAIIDFYAFSPDTKARSGFISSMSYCETDPQKGIPEGQYNDSWLPSPVKTLMSPEAYLQEYFAMYFGVSSMEVLNIRHLEGEEAENLWNIQQQQQAMLNEGSAQVNASTEHAQNEVRFSLNWAEVDMRFVLEGVTYKIVANCAIGANSSTIYSSDLYTSFSYTDIFWNVSDIRYYCAEESIFDNTSYTEPSIAFQNNLIINAQWNDSIRQTSQAIFSSNADVAIKDFQAIQAQLQQQAQQIAAQGQQNYSTYSPASSSGDGGYDTDVMGGWTNVLTGQSYYEAPDGGSVLLDYNDYHYTDGSSIYSSSTPINTGGTNLSPLTDLGTMGGD